MFDVGSLTAGIADAPNLMTKVGAFLEFMSIVSLCAGIIFAVYRYTSPDESDAFEFASTIFIMTITTGLLVSIIKQAAAISFGLFGAMSIVRFRAQIKKTKRMIFVLMASAIGVCCGSGEYVSTILGTVVLSAFSLGLAAWAPVAAKPNTAAKPGAGATKSGAARPGQPAPDGKDGDGGALVGAWGIDFLPLYLANGRRARVLVISDGSNRDVLALVPEASFSPARIIG